MAQQGIHGVWANRWTFVLAATGSAVGLGNIWKFPYITGENGGGAFVLVYLLCIALIGIPIMVAEVLLGRRGRQSPINSMRYVAKEAGLSSNWSAVGWMGVLAGLFILSFYSVVAGWALHYVFQTGTGAFEGATREVSQGVFGELLSNNTALISWHTVFILMTVGVVMAGVTRGLAMVARVLMPLLFVMLIMLLGYGMAAGDYVGAAKFMFSFKVSALSWDGVLIAMGHAFFTLSLGMGSIMAYGAYMPSHSNIGQTVVTVGVLDTLVALVAGMCIFPIVFASGIEPSSGPGLLFQSLPVAFGNMPGGLFFGTLFFILVSIAAWSSAVSLIEPGVAWLIETGKFNRVTANLVLGGASWLVGISCALSYNLLADFKPLFLANRTPFDFLDFLTAQVMLPLGGLFIAIFVGWRMAKAVMEDEMDAEGHPMLDIWLFVLRYISPVLVVIVFVMTLMNTFAG
ncbi:sodium-dependent transporter [Saccharophagus degradans]|uniref:Transporter n=1 Tax=Saccharophagus degradans (strain 2-40 / ATCC 43961 / DSM 17024) TaxID=203122 RepID=Q21H29_SACD2|nr:sodium-dependent transporter [Saccharophagus degradans]ABD82000.1 sodium:neurotransmitter symporter [Saccharophagus degradans 2-40]